MESKEYLIDVIEKQDEIIRTQSEIILNLFKQLSQYISIEEIEKFDAIEKSQIK